MPEPDHPKGRREIVVVSHYYDTHGGGIERAVRHLIEEFAVFEDFHFTWAASADACIPAESGGNAAAFAGQVLPMKSWNDLEPMEGWHFIERLFAIPWPVWNSKSLGQLRAAIRRADVVWLHDTLYMGNIIAFIMARNAGKPVVITQHIGTVPYRNPILRDLMRFADRIFTRPMLQKAAQAIFVSDRIAEDYNRKVPFKMPVIIIPNGVDPEIFYPVPAEQRWQLRAKFALRDDQPVMLFVGRFTEKKGLPAIRHLSELLPEWRFWLAGQGPIDPSGWYRPNVHVFGERTGADLADLYRAADLLILPSFGEGFPLVVQEAMACGLPVLCSSETAAGSQLAKPFLLTAAVDPKAPARTAATWARKLKSQREFLPLAQANADLAAAAHYFWPWPKIAECYAVIFDDLCESKA